jgi:predicted metal-binding membrane protein
MLQRDRLVLLTALLWVLALAWGWLLSGAGMEMSPADMTAMAGMDGWLMRPAVWTPAYAAVIFAMWWVMMVAMMLPSATATLLLFARVNRKGKTARAPLLPTMLFSVGYLLTWGAFGLVATALQWGLESVRLLSPMLETTHKWLGACILIAAGLWQMTPVKTICLRHCRTPLSFLIARWRPSSFGALRMGIEHGVFCVGCCWFLMLLLFFGGVMNLYWIVGLALYVLVEKMVPLGHHLSRVAGVTLMLGAAVLLFESG